ncbi:hypothetical protein C8T65DRAFT_727679 [Cerioporus squamosus]|nr:hypothetical protein C8T65DRAFT_727679 [Cerioporus squamosus]
MSGPDAPPVKHNQQQSHGVQNAQTLDVPIDVDGTAIWGAVARAASICGGGDGDVERGGFLRCYRTPVVALFASLWLRSFEVLLSNLRVNGERWAKCGPNKSSIEVWAIAIRKEGWREEEGDQPVASPGHFRQGGRAWAPPWSITAPRTSVGPEARAATLRDIADDKNGGDVDVGRGLRRKSQLSAPSDMRPDGCR